MTDQITVPRATWDAMREALISCIPALEQYEVKVEREWGCGRSLEELEERGEIPHEIKQAREALTAANAVSNQDLPVGKCGVLSKSEPQAQGEAAKKYAENLCISMARKFYPEVTQFEPLDDLFGLLTQIDNMTTGLVRPQATEPAWIAVSDRLPEEDKRVLVWYRGHVSTTSMWLGSFITDSSAQPTHWMPLPAEPEAKQ